MRRATLALVFATVCLSTVINPGCLGTSLSAWDTSFPDNNELDTNAVVGRVPAPTPTGQPLNSLGRPVLAAVKLGTPPHLLVHDLSTQQTLWDREVPVIDSRPLILHDIVLFVAGRHIVAWDLASGNERWRYEMPEDWTFRGAAADSGRVYISIGKGSLGSVQRRDGMAVCLNAQTGGRLWRHEVPFLLAAPAAVNGLVFVPWDGQNITILDGAAGTEIARLRSLDDVIHFVSARPEGVFYGARGLYRLTNQSVVGRREGTTFYGVPMQDVPGDPEFELSGYELPSLSMRKIRYFWSPEVGEEGQLAMADNALYLLYFRFVFAFDAASGQLRWAYRFNEDVEGIHVVPGGLYMVGRHGIVTFLGAQSGDAEWESEIGVRIRSISFSLGGLQPPERRQVEQPDVRQRLQEVIFDPDNRLLPIRTFALGLLAGIDDPEVTQDLLEVTSRHDVPDQLREASAQALAGRDSGAAFLVDALAVHHDYLSRARPVPLNIVSRTLTQMQSAEAVPALIEHMMDHETSLEDLREVVAAIVALGDANVVSPLRDFLVRYHRDSAFAENSEALNVIANGLLQHGAIDEEELLRSMAANTQTLGPLRDHINEAFAAREAAAQPEEVPEEAVDTGPTPEQICAQQRQENYQLTQDQINQIMRAAAPNLRQCFTDEMSRNPDTAAVRIVWLLTNEGEGINWNIAPRSPELLTCLLPHLRDIQFPCIRSYRQRARFGIQLRRPRAAQPQTPQTPQTPPAGGGWGPPPPGVGTGTDTGTEPDGGVSPDQYPDQYPDELPE